MNEIAFDYLNRDYLLNVDIIESLRRGDSEVLRAGDDGVIVREREGYLYFLSCDTVEAAKRLTDGYDIHLCVLHGCEHIDEIAAMTALDHGRECCQVAYTKSEPADEGSADIRVLSPEYAEFVCGIYGHGDIEQIARQLEDGTVWGIFVDNEIAGFMGRHDEGSMGMLEILPEYRRRGLASLLEAGYINRVRSLGEIPYGQVYTDNLASLALQKKLGLDISQRHICWMWNHDDDD